MSGVSSRSPVDERARTERGLLGFYASCTVFGIATAITAVVWIVFPGVEGLAALGWAGVGVAAISAVATWHYLGVMRKER
ncbi:MAG: hypothetical protein AB7I19_15175 [Planctomycetota bacterium]